MHVVQYNEFVQFGHNFPLATIVAILNFLNFQEFCKWAGDKDFTNISCCFWFKSDLEGLCTLKFNLTGFKPMTSES